ncbi:MAG: hypothetical protein C4519_01245 [Desulfobacteraceae bacterium]|nr:MAG: hypothetical protein C4519_01245 [Desulfobacteraceae bacterium]
MSTVLSNMEKALMNPIQTESLASANEILRVFVREKKQKSHQDTKVTFRAPGLAAADIRC